MRHVLPAALLCAVLLSCEGAPSPTGASSDALWNEGRGRPQLLTGALFSAEGDAESTAKAFLATRAAEFHLDGAGASLELVTTRTGLNGTYLRFGQRQRVGDAVLPVFDGEVIVLVRDEGAQRVVRAANLEHLEAASTVADVGDLGPARASELALARVDLRTGDTTAGRGVFVTKAGVARVAWQVKVSTESPPHDWSLFIDAATGDELGRRDGVRFVDGSAYVYDMNPVASTGDLRLVDGNDATTANLDAARFLVVLPRLDGSGNLSGTWASTFTKNSGRANSSTNQFLFARDNLGFEQANVYFHLDRTQAHLQALGFTNVNNRVQEAIVDAQTADNSFYSSNNLRLNFGKGGVDDAEDADIVTHEYGHSIQDNQVPGYGNGDEGAMGEGFGDYLAASFALSLAADAGHPQRSDPACVGDWDGVSYSTTVPRCLRRVDGTKHYPEGEAGEVHDDGEMWSAALWDLRGRLGAPVVDRLLIESHFLLGTNSSFFTASQALISTDVTRNAGVNGATLRRRFIQHGLSRTLTTPASPGTVSSFAVAMDPPRATTGLYASSVDDTQTLTVPGARGLVVHFARIELETHNSCFQTGCDNIYLTNGDGDLFQVFSGAQTNVTSVAVAGDTVNVRLVADGSQERFGYHVDRVDVLDAPLDAGVVYDAGVVVPPPFDAGVPPLPDAGVPPVMDAGQPPVEVDAGVVDAGQPVAPDAGFTSTVSYGAVGNETFKPALKRGCGCTTGGGLEAWAALALLGMISRRRR